jgi:hypothetical protein
MQAARARANDPAPALAALVLSALLHAVAFAWLSHPLDLPIPSRSSTIARSVAPIPAAKLPPSLRLAEPSPAGNREAPRDTPFEAARNQAAAQPSPRPGAESALPRSEGESADSLRLAQAVPRPPEPAAAPPAPPLPEAGTPRVALPTPEPRRVNPLLAQPSRPAGTSGLLLRNPVDVGRAGALALDARFSAYGDYAQRMLEAIQASWWGILSRTRLDDFAAGSVVVRFRLARDGTVPHAEIVSSSVPTLAALACMDAVRLPAPYDAWRPEMVALRGEEETVTLTFHYR